MQVGQQRAGAGAVIADREVVLAYLAGKPAHRRGLLLLQMLKGYRAEITAPLLEENARLRAEVQQLKTTARCAR